MRPREYVRAKKFPFQKVLEPIFFYTPSLAHGTSRVLVGTAADGLSRWLVLIWCTTSRGDIYDIAIIFRRGSLKISETYNNAIQCNDLVDLKSFAPTS